MKPKANDQRLSGSGPEPLRALSRGLGILSQFTAREPALSLSELSRRTGLHRATVYRFVKTLQTEGFLTLDAAAGLYRIGPAWAAALYSMGGNSVLVDILDRDLRQLAETTGEGASLSVRKGDHVQIVDVVSVFDGEAPPFPASSLVPLSNHAIVHSRIHLAYSSDDTKARMTAVPPVRYTDQTVTDRDQIRARLDQAAAEGIAYSRDEYKKGLSALAVPLLFKGDMVAALGLIVHSEHFDDEHVERYTRELRMAAAMMSRKLDENAGRLFPKD